MTIEEMTLAEAIAEHGVDILDEAVSGGYKDGYHVVGGRHGQLQHSPTYPHTTSASAIRHANRVEDSSGYVSHVHHVKGGKIHQSWHFSDSDQKFSPHKDFKGEEAHHILGHNYMHESEEAEKSKMTSTIRNLTEAVLEKNALVVESLFNDIILEKISEVLETPSEPSLEDMTITQFVESYGEESIDALMENLTIGDLIEEFGVEILDEFSKEKLLKCMKPHEDNIQALPKTKKVARTNHPIFAKQKI